MVAPANPRAARTGGVLRAAATMMVVRDGAGADQAPLEVLMLRRTLHADFMGGAFVFPGGSVDPADGSLEALGRCAGRDDEGASAVLGIGSGGLAYWVAALRECFEESGLLLARSRPSSEPVSFAEPAVAERFVGHRRQLNAGHRRFSDVLAEEDLVLSVDQVHYFAHWITPEGAPRRYDTRFFVAAAPAGQTPVHDAAETIADRWLRPLDALAQQASGEIELILPTIKTLQAISRFETAAQLLEAADRMGSVPAVLPRVVADGRGLRILLPGDPGYAEATLGAPATPELFDLATRAASKAEARAFSEQSSGEGTGAPDRTR